MKVYSVARLLEPHPFAQGLKPEYLELMAGCAENVRFEPGSYLFHEDEEASKLFLVRSGQVSMEIFVPGRGPLQVETVGEGGVVGWSWMLAPYRWHFDARAVEPSRVLVLDGECLRKKCEADARLGYEVLKRLMVVVQHRVESLRLQLADVYRAHP